MVCINCNKENRDDFTFCRCCETKNKPSEFDLLDKSLNNLDWQFYLDNGEELVDRRKFHDALEFFEKALELNPIEPDIYVARGKCYTHILSCKILDFKYKEAHDDFEMALKLNPNHLQALNSMGNVKRRLKKYSESIEMFDHAISIDPLFVDAIGSLAYTYQCMGEYHAAKKNALKALKITPNHPESYYVYGYSLVYLCDFKKGITILKKAAANKSHIAQIALNNIQPIKYLFVIEIENKGFIIEQMDDEKGAEIRYKRILEILNQHPYSKYYNILQNPKNIASYTIKGNQNNLTDVFLSSSIGTCTISVIKIDTNTFSLKSFIKKRENNPVFVVKKNHSLVFDKCDIEDECQLDGELLKNSPNYSIAKELPTPNPSYVNIMGSYRTESVL